MKGICNPVKHLDYYHKKINVQVASRVAKRLKTNDLCKFEIFKKILELFVNDGFYPETPVKRQILTVVPRKFEKSVAKQSIRKPILLNFVSLSTIFCPILSMETYF